MVVGLLLVVVGLVGYGMPQAIVTDSEGELVEKVRSWTALIPAIVGLPILLCGIWIAVKPSATKTAMHVAATFGMLGALASTGRAVSALIGLVRAEGEFNQRTFAFLSIMAVLCWMFVIFCVGSFIQARKVRVRSQS